MCMLCEYISLRTDSYAIDYHALLDAIKEIKKDHPWHFLVGPMSDEERVWYDTNSPLRKPKNETT